jgi:hypothetical protein
MSCFGDVSVGGIFEELLGELKTSLAMTDNYMDENTISCVVDQRADVWAFGVPSLVLLTGV